jgi:3-hydroxyacyl-[acyl-carrier-protein] dehydratase
VLTLEALAQTAALLSFESMDTDPGEDMVVYFVGIDGARFKRPVRPGDQLVFEVELLRMSRGLGKFRAVARVDGTVAAEAELLCVLRPVEAGA